MHRILVKDNVTAVRERIERVLGVTTQAQPVPAEYGVGWAVDWTGPRDMDVDFLRPDVLPPL